MRSLFRNFWNRINIPTVITTLVLLTLTGFFNKLGELLFDALTGALPKFWSSILSLILRPITISLWAFILIIVVLIPVATLTTGLYFRIRRHVEIFFDDFATPNRYWGLNYWQGKAETVRFEGNHLVLQAATLEEWPATGCNGAYIDLTYGIYENETYEISCRVKSSPNSTMGFQLWVHDTVGKDKRSLDPQDFETPPNDYKLYKTTFVTTKTKAIRVHLHARIGTGSILVSDVKVVKI